MKATLVLDNGARFEGVAFGGNRPMAGEVVFCTAMTGYPEILTDPAYAGQIVVITYPLVGNYGVPSHEAKEDGLECFFESAKIQARGLVVTDYSKEYSHWNAAESLDDWMRREGVPGISGIDTRALTQMLRQEGVMRGQIVWEGNEPVADAEVYADTHYVAEVSCKDVLRYNEGAAKKVVLVDCGCKHSTIRGLMARNVEVVRVPWNYDFTGMEYDGVWVSEGPGNPALCEDTVAHLRKAMQQTKPMMGVGLGHLLMAMAAGAQVSKAKYGHHGSSISVRQEGTPHCMMTAQANDYVVEAATLPTGWKATYVNMNDGTNVGFAHETKPWSSVMFYPEMACAPYYKDKLVDEFVASL